MLIYKFKQKEKKSWQDISYSIWKPQKVIKYSIISIWQMLLSVTKCDLRGLGWDPPNLCPRVLLCPGWDQTTSQLSTLYKQ